MERIATVDALPDYLIHKIVSHISFRNASPVRFLSKTWRQAWLTHPNLDFRYLSHGDPEKVDRIMERYRDEKIPIDKFEFSTLLYYDDELLPLVDKWLGIALQNGVEEIKYRHSSLPLPTFKKTLAAKCLSLVDCDLMRVSLSSGDANFDSLRKVSLSCVLLDESMLQTLLNCCPLIVSFNIKYCSGLKTIELRNLQKIKSVHINANKNQLVIIQAPSLEHLYYCGAFEESPMLDIVECRNLKSLELGDMLKLHEFLPDLISTVQTLENLKLVRVYTRSKRLYLCSKRFNLCCGQSLRVLKIRDCNGIKEIDAPNLASLEYEGEGIPELKISIEPSQLKQLKINLVRLKNLDAAWFCKLREILPSSISWCQVSLRCIEYNEINTNDLQLCNRVAIPQVDVLDVYISRWGELPPTFMDALLWSCHPRKLCIGPYIDVITCFMDHLMKNLSYSTDDKSNPWHSQLKEVKAYKIDEKKQHVELRSGELAKWSLGWRENIYFLLDW